MISTTPFSCGCRGCGNIIAAHTEIVMTGRGPFHPACVPLNEPPDLQLQFGGRLVISGARAGIEYAFPGTDRRYRWSHHYIRHEDLLKTSEALRANWIEYERLKPMVPSGSTIERIGLLGMNVRVSPQEPGVWLFGRQIGVWNQEQTNRLAEEYEHAFERLKSLLLIGSTPQA